MRRRDTCDSGAEAKDRAAGLLQAPVHTGCLGRKPQDTVQDRNQKGVLPSLWMLVPGQTV